MYISVCVSLLSTMRDTGMAARRQSMACARETYKVEAPET